MVRLHRVKPALDGEAADGFARELDRKAATAGDADLRDDAQRHVLGADMDPKPPLDPHPHAFWLLQRNHLGGEHVFQLRGAAAERQRAEAPDRAGVAVRHRMSCARQHHAELRRHHMGDAVVGIAEVEHADAMPPAAVAGGAQESGAVRIGVVGAIGLGGHHVIECRECQVRPPHAATGLGQLAERVRRMQVMQHMAVDIDEVAPIGAPRHQVGIPDFIEQRLRHRAFAFRKQPDRGRPCHAAE